MVGCFECCNELSGSIKCVEFLDYLRTYELRNKNTTP